MSNLIKMTEVKEYTHHWRSSEKRYFLRETLINPSSVVMIYEDEDFKYKMVHTGRAPEDLNEESTITKVVLSASSQSGPLVLHVVGNLEIIIAKLGGD